MGSRRRWSCAIIIMIVGFLLLFFSLSLSLLSPLSVEIHVTFHLNPRHTKKARKVKEKKKANFYTPLDQNKQT